MDAETKRLVEVLEKMEGINGAKGFAGTLKGSKLPAFREGLKTQAKRAEHYYNDKLLVQIEKKEEGTRIDLVIKSAIDADVLDKNGKIYVEVKHWTGFSKWTKIEQEERLVSLEKQLNKYRSSNENVLLEWKGVIPASVKLLCDDLTIEVKSI